MTLGRGARFWPTCSPPPLRPTKAPVLSGPDPVHALRHLRPPGHHHRRRQRGGRHRGRRRVRDRDGNRQKPVAWRRRGADVCAGGLLAGGAGAGRARTFTGYGSLAESDVRVRAIIKQGARVDEASPGDGHRRCPGRDAERTPRAAARSATRARSSARRRDACRERLPQGCRRAPLRAQLRGGGWTPCARATP